MKTGLVVVAVIVLAALIVGGWFVSVNNELVAKDQVVQESWAQVQNVYQRRADLIPNLVETVKGPARAPPRSSSRPRPSTIRPRCGGFKKRSPSWGARSAGSS